MTNLKKRIERKVDRACKIVPVTLVAGWIALVILAHPGGLRAANPDTMIVSAEGLADPNADTYKRDKGLLLDDLREDAKRQVIEKAVGTFVESSTLVENYKLIQDKVMTRTKGLIKRVIKESDPWLGKDGFMHMLMKAEVYLTDVREAVQSMSKAERIDLIKEHGNPRIAVAVTVRDAKRGPLTVPERSPVAENILKKHLSAFGYRVWSEEAGAVIKAEMMEKDQEAAASIAGMKTADFSIRGEAKFKQLKATLKASGLTITKYVLTSWTVKCVDNHTAEEIYFNNKIPRRKSWNDEDAALADIGKLIGEEFSQDFFEGHLMRATRIYQLHLMGLPDYDSGVLFKRELIGLRPVLNVDFRNFDAKGLSLYEVEFSGTRGNFLRVVNNTVVKPLNKKFGEDAFKLLSAQGETVKIGFKTSGDPKKVVTVFEERPPASLSDASPERLKSLIKDEKTMKKVAEINPEGVDALTEEEKQQLIADDSKKAVEQF